MTWLECRFGQWIVAYRWWLLVLAPLLMVLAGSGIRHLEMTTNYRVFFSSENPQLKAFEDLERTYTQDDNVFILLHPKDGEVFTLRTLEAVRDLTEQAWQVPYSIRVDSITNFQHTAAAGDDLAVTDLVEDPGSLSPRDLARIREIALSEPMLRNRLISPTGHVTAVNITVQLPRVDETVEVPKVAEAARVLVSSIRDRYPEIEVYLSGMVIMNNTFSEISRGDMAFLVPISLGIMLLVLGGLTRSLSGTFATLLVLVLSITAAMGAGGWIGFPITAPSSAAPTVILTIAIASSVHVLVSFQHELFNGLERKQAIVESLRVNLQPVFLTSLTTAVGFLSLNFSEAPPFRHLGNFVAMGVVASFFLVIVFLPALMAVLPIQARKGTDHRAETMARFGDFVVRKRKPLFWGMLVLIVCVVAQLPRNELNDVFVHYFDDRVEFRRHADFIDEHLSGLYRVDYSLKSGKAGGIAEPEFLRQVSRFADFVVRKRKPLFWGMLVLIVCVVAQLPRNELNDVFVHYFDDRVEFRRHADFIDEHLSGLYRVDYSLKSGKAGGIAEPEFLRQVSRFADFLRAQPEVVHVDALTDTMKRLNKNMHGDDPEWYRLPEDRELAAQYLLLYEMSLPYGLDLNNRINVAKSATRLSATFKILSTKEVLALEERARRWLRENAPELETQGASPTIMFAHIGERNIRSMLVGATVALLLISLILLVALRSVKMGLISLIPNLVPAAMGFGLWAMMVGEVGLALSVVSGMTLGIVVDDTVHFLSKYLRARRERGLDSADAVRYAFRSVGTALWITSAVLVAGFLVLSLSAFELNAGMGLMTAVVIALALVADFLFLPPLLMRFDESTSHVAKNNMAPESA